MLKVLKVRRGEKPSLETIANPPAPLRTFHTKPRPVYDLMPQHTGKEPCLRYMSLYSQDDEDMHPEDIEAVKHMCEVCPIVRDCFTYALHSNENGIWGGTTTDERQKFRYIADL